MVAPLLKTLTKARGLKLSRGLKLEGTSGDRNTRIGREAQEGLVPSVGGLKLEGVWGPKLEGQEHTHRQGGTRVAARWLQGATMYVVCVVCVCVCVCA